MSFDGVAGLLGMGRTSFWDRRRKDPTLEAEVQQATAEWELEQVELMSARAEDLDERKFALELLRHRKPHNYGALKDVVNRDKHVEDEAESAPVDDSGLSVALEAILEARKAGRL